MFSFCICLTSSLLRSAKSQPAASNFTLSFTPFLFDHLPCLFRSSHPFSLCSVFFLNISSVRCSSPQLSLLILSSFQCQICNHLTIPLLVFHRSLIDSSPFTFSVISIPSHYHFPISNMLFYDLTARLCFVFLSELSFPNCPFPVMFLFQFLYFVTSFGSVPSSLSFAFLR